jgi:hypothetical protein
LPGKNMKNRAMRGRIGNRLSTAPVLVDALPDGETDCHCGCGQRAANTMKHLPLFKVYQLLELRQRSNLPPPSNVSRRFRTQDRAERKGAGTVIFVTGARW